MSYTTIKTDARYMDYADIGCGQAAMAALGIPVNYYEAAFGATAEFVGNTMAFVGKLMAVGGRSMKNDGLKKAKENKRKVETYIYMKK